MGPSWPASSARVTPARGLSESHPGTQLYAVKVLDALGAGWVHQVICGIDWVTANAKSLGIRVANMSLSQELQDDALHLAVKRSADSGIVYTVAAGNADPGGLPRDIAYESPASYPEVLTVTAASDTDGAPGGSGPASCDPDGIGRQLCDVLQFRNPPGGRRPCGRGARRVHRIDRRAVVG